MSEREKTDAPPRPNIVLILVDDMGYSDIGRYGSEIDTPNLDRLAGRGMVFSQMYNCARCCPTRASLLTGLYPHRTGVGQMMSDLGHPSYQGFLNDRCVTIAEALKVGGYRTYMAGKWHVGGPYVVADPAGWMPGDARHPTPVQRGFDEHYGILCGAGSYFRPPTLIHNDRFVEPDGEGWYFTDAVSDHAVRMIEHAARHGEPFFLYTAYTAPHWPLHAPAEAVAKYRGRYACGWDALRTARHERLNATGLLEEKWPISPRDPQAPAWSDVPDKDLQDARMAVYAAQIEIMDRGVGRILDALRRTGRADNTVVIFLSDNGGCHEFLTPGNRWVGTLDTGSPDGRPMKMGNLPDVLPGPPDTYQSYTLPWANASNTPFRLHKHWVHEGGISTPLIVHYPGVSRPGSVRHEVCHVIDILPTCLDIAGVDYPAGCDGRAVPGPDGRSILPLLRGEPEPAGRVLFWEHEGNRAVRDGRWKLVNRYNGSVGPWELYDMVEDRTELNDLAAAKPGKVAELVALYDRWAEDVGVVPWERISRR